MYHSSTQQKHWTFTQEEVRNLRKKAHNDYISWAVSRMGNDSPFLTLEEEEVLLSHYGGVILELCNKFKPPAPAAVYGTSLQYFRRVYLSTSVMDYHPREVVFTCIFFATKVEEYNVSLSQFVTQLSPDFRGIGEFVISTEMLIMQKLNFHLTVHNPYRAMEGFFIDIKVRFPEIKDPERYRGNAEKFVTRCMLTYACFTYAPSTIALAGLKSVFHKYLDKYIIQILGNGQKGYELMKKLDGVISMVSSFSPPSYESVSKVENKLSLCRNQETNPHSEHYRETEMREREKKEQEKMHQYELSKQRQNELIEELGIASMEGH